LIKKIVRNGQDANCCDQKCGKIKLAGAGGIEPPNAGIKIRCLTAWRRPNNEAVYSCFVSREQ
jgi:hypothetical protein